MLFRSLKSVALATAVLLAGCQGGVLDPKGQVGADEKTLIIISTVLMLVVVIPVIAMTLFFAWKYREGRDQEVYAPKWSHSVKIETAVWLIPIVIIVILGTITWRSTQALDPYKPLEHEREPLTVEVVSLNWKWLFIYPEQGVASVNELVFPEDVPVRFKITSESTMNSFFIPQLGSQIYAMAGMETKLHLIANEPGTYDGFSANYSGAGFTDMQFKAIATDEAGFERWLSTIKKDSPALSQARYDTLAEPSENHAVEHFGAVSDGLFHRIINQYMKNYNDWNSGPASSPESPEPSTSEHSAALSAGADSEGA